MFRFRCTVVSSRRWTMCVRVYGRVVRVDDWTYSLVRSQGCGKTIFYPFFVQDDTSRVERGFGRGVKSRADAWMGGWME